MGDDATRRLVPVDGFAGYYVSDDGFVWSDKWRSMRRLVGYPTGALGHLLVSLRRDGKSHKRLVHRLVAAAFLAPPKEGQVEVRHLDDNSTNNVYTNLAWGTHQQNMQDMVDHCRQGPTNHPERMARGDRHGSKTHPESVPRGERAGGVKLTESDVVSIRTRLAAGERLCDLAREFGVTIQAVFRIRERLCWKHVA